MRRVLDEMTHMVKLLSRPNSPQSTSVSELVEELRLKYNYLIGEGGVDFHFPSDLPVVRADREKIREAIGVLIANALTFTDRKDGDRLVAVECSREQSGYRFCVRDNGVGIDPRYCDQIFELGLKLDKSRGEGAGYGLYMARQIVASHGGRLTVESDQAKAVISASLCRSDCCAPKYSRALRRRRPERPGAYRREVRELLA